MENILRSFTFNLDWHKTESVDENALADSIRGGMIQATIIVDAIISVVGWMERAAVNLAEFQEELYYSAQRNRTAIAEMRAFDLAVANMGGFAEIAQKTIDKFAYNLRSNVGFYDLLVGLGVKVRDVNGKMRDSVALLEDLGKVMARMTYQQQVGYAALFGIDEQTMRAITNADFGKTVAEFKGIVQAGNFDPQAAAKAWVDFNNTFRRFMAVLDLLWEKILTEFVKEFGAYFTVMTNYLIEHSSEITDIINAIIDNIIKIAVDLTDEAGGIPGVMRALRSALHSVAVVLEWIRVRVARIIAGTLFLKRKTDDFRRGSEFIYRHPLSALEMFGTMAGEDLGLIAPPTGGPGVGANIADVPSIFDEINQLNRAAPEGVYSGGGGGGGGGSAGSGFAGGSPSDIPPTGGGGTLPAGGLATSKKLADHLMQKYGLTREQAIGAVGVLHYESGGFKTLQEGAPTIPGSAGGFGFAQWTGPRRRAYFAWAKEHNLDPRSYEANEGFIDFELASPGYKAVIPALKTAKTARDAAYWWEYHYEGMREGGPGIPAFAEHMRRAEQLDRQLPQDLATPSTAPVAPAGVASGKPVLSEDALNAFAKRNDSQSGGLTEENLKAWIKTAPEDLGKASNVNGTPLAANVAPPTHRVYDRVTNVDIRNATSTNDAARQIAMHQAAINRELAKAAGELANG